MSFCDDCFKGVVHEGSPTGKWELIDGVDCYVNAPPDGNYDKDVVVLHLTDAFGPQMPNNQLLADSFALNGYKIVVPDYFNGDPVDPAVMESSEPFNFTSWKARHGKEQTRPPLDKVINALKDSGVTKFAAVGFCFGARYVFDVAFDDILKVSVVTHPSLLVVPDDLEKYRDTVKAPLLINSCETDHAFNQDAQAAADKILKDFGPGYSREYFEGVSHGFTVRGDLNDPKVKEGRERAFKITIEWLKKYL